MQTTYHFKSAAEITPDIIESIKSVFKNKSIMVTVEDEVADTVPEWQKKMVRERLEEMEQSPDKMLSEEDFQMKFQQLKK